MPPSLGSLDWWELDGVTTPSGAYSPAAAAPSDEAVYAAEHDQNSRANGANNDTYSHSSRRTQLTLIGFLHNLDTDLGIGRALPVVDEYYRSIRLHQHRAHFTRIKFFLLAQGLRQISLGNEVGHWRGVGG